MSLVDYSSDSDVEIQETSTSPCGGVSNDLSAGTGSTVKPKTQPSAQPPTCKKRKLPTLPDGYGSNPHDDPTQHQGRSRSRPFVDGDYNAHIYISLDIPSALRNVFNKSLEKARSLLPHDVFLHSFLERPAPLASCSRSSRMIIYAPTSSSLPLHISLTHPLPLRRSQIPDFLAAIKQQLVSMVRNDSRDRQNRCGDDGAFRISFASGFTVYHNGLRFGGEGIGGRAFLALRVGAGANELEHIVDNAIHPILKNFHLPIYHTNPEFHTSIAWCLLRRSPNRSDDPVSLDRLDEEETLNLKILDESEMALSSSSRSDADNSNTPLSDDIIAKLNDEFNKLVLEAQPVGGWYVDEICIKVAKTVYRVSLCPSR